MTKEELATERNEVREILEGFSEELSQSNLNKLSRVFCVINGDEKRIAELEEKIADSNKAWNELVEGWKEDCKELEKENAELKESLEYAKAIVRELLNNSNEYARQNAEDFIKELDK